MKKTGLAFNKFFKKDLNMVSSNLLNHHRNVLELLNKKYSPLIITKNI